MSLFSLNNYLPPQEKGCRFTCTNELNFKETAMENNEIEIDGKKYKWIGKGDPSMLILGIGEILAMNSIIEETKPEKEVNRFEFEKPKVGEKYWFANPYPRFKDWELWTDHEVDIARYEAGNTYSSEALLEKSIEKDKALKQLKDIAHRLNDGVEIDWEDREQDKYYIYYDREELELSYSRTYTTLQDERTYSLSDNFLETALSEMGEEKLKLAIGGE